VAAQRSQTHSRFAEQHDDGEPRFVGEGFEEVEWWSMGSCRCDFYMRLIIYVLVAREKIRLEKGFFRQQKTHL
jgi:hypothetical protein